MPNTYFQFKQFRVEQDHCAMKVCTDTCIQGAYTAAWINHTDQINQRILDIGAGTGLLTLMLAQELSTAQMDAIELDETTYLQAKENFNNSSWAARIHLVQGDIRTASLSGKYDFIICNPPFYKNDLKSDHHLKNKAKHGVTLNYKELMDAIIQNISTEGAFCVMLPAMQFGLFKKMAEGKDFYPEHILGVRQKPDHPIFRYIGYFKQGEQILAEDELCIADNTNEYTVLFKTLLKKYYLYL